MTPVFDALQHAFPWPDIHGKRAWNFTLGGKGRYLVDDIIHNRQPRDMLEIGCFLCASSRRWLQADPNLRLVGVDPWPDTLIAQSHRYVGRQSLSRVYPDIADQQQFVRDMKTQGPFATAVANMSEFKDRFVPVKNYSPQALYDLKAMGYEPDLIYIDCNKKPDDLDISHTLWPRAILAGDDWHWRRKKDFPMRQIVRSFAQKHDYSIIADHATWVLQKPGILQKPGQAQKSGNRSMQHQRADITVEAARPGHRDTLVQLTKYTINACYPAFLGQAPVEGYLSSGMAEKYYQENLENCLIIHSGSDIVGCGATKDNSVDLMLIHPSFHRSGLGSILLRALEDRLLGRYNHIFLESFQNNHKANSFYTRNGWKKDRATTDDYDIDYWVFVKQGCPDRPSS